MCRGVGWSGLPMLKSTTSSPRRRAASFSSPVTLKTYGGRRFILENSSTGVPAVALQKRAILAERLTLSKSYSYEVHQTVKLHLTPGAGLHLFSGYGAGYVSVNNVRYEKCVVVTPQAVSEWAVGGFEKLVA